MNVHAGKERLYPDLGTWRTGEIGAGEGLHICHDEPAATHKVFRTPKVSDGSHQRRPHRHSACRMASVHWTVMVSTHNPRNTSLDRSHGQLTVHAVPWCVTLNNSLQCRHRAVTGNLAVCCIQAVIVAFPSGGNLLPGSDASRSHSASISSYVVSISANVGGQRRGPAIRDGRIATGRANWRPFAGSSVRPPIVLARTLHNISRLLPHTVASQGHW